MSAGFIASQEKKIGNLSGSNATVPKDGICRLSYYLNCVDSCINMITNPRLTHYQNANYQPRHVKDSIIVLACAVLDAETLLRSQILIIDDDHKFLPRDSANIFAELHTVSKVFGVVASQALVGGQNVKLSKIMLCTTDWLDKYFLKAAKACSWRVQAILRDSDAVARVLASSLKAPETGVEEGFEAMVITPKSSEDNEENHCGHCAGGEGRCACPYGCAIKASTACSAARRHCSHCKGLASICSCKMGCPATNESLCRVVHFGVKCDSCGLMGIEGPRFKCQDCYNYDLCQDCYQDGAHEKTHSFVRIARVGSPKVALAPREAKRPPVVDPPPPVDSRRNTPDIPKGSAPTEYVDAKSPAASAIPLATATPFEHPSYAQGSNVRLQGLQSMAEYNGSTAVVVQDVGDKVLVCLPQHGNRNLKVKKENLEPPPASSSPVLVGDLVELRGLNRSDMNGQMGMVTEALSNGRFLVDLFNDGLGEKSFKADNLRVVADAE